MNDGPTPKHRITLVGGPLDGWPILIRGRLPDQLTLPYSREMLDLAARSPTPDSRELWDELRFPSESAAAGVAIYRPGSEADAVHPRYLFAGMKE